METLLSSVIVKTIMVSLHSGRFVVVQLYSSFPIDPQNFPRGANLYQKLPFLVILGVARVTSSLACQQPSVLSQCL